MERTVISEFDTDKGLIGIYTETSRDKPSPRWFATIAFPGGITFTMIERNSEISRDEVLKMI